MKQLRKPNMKIQWTKCIIALVALAAFLIWIKSWWGIIAAPFIFDLYITRKINWDWWKDLENPFMVTIMSWIDAIVFALVAVYFVNIYFFQNYTIPSSSLEKSLLIGDYLFVSKMSYGPRKPMTPLSMPLMQHTSPFGTKSYIEKPQWDYERVNYKPITRGDIVVFNYPAGDTVVSNPVYQSQDFYILCHNYGRNIYQQQHGPLPSLDALTKFQQRDFLNRMYYYGKQFLIANNQEFGEIMWRPVDRRENYVKRCVGIAGDTLQIKDGKIYINNVMTKQPDNVQHNYYVELKEKFLPDSLRERLDISNDDYYEFMNRSSSHFGILPLTDAARKELESSGFCLNISYVYPNDSEDTYPQNMYKKWTCDNYGPIWIPKRGESIKLSIDNIAIYERCIVAYEGNMLEVKENGDIIINGKKTDSYTFKMDYYWMQGDNRHNSADSRYWGFVPEDHIVGKPILIWLSTNKDHGLFNGGIRWNRMFRWVKNIK